LNPSSHLQLIEIFGDSNDFPGASIVALAFSVRRFVMKIKNLSKFVFGLTAFLLTTALCAEALPPAPFDYDGDGKTDILVRRLNSDNNYIWYALESKNGFNATVWGGAIPGVFGDGKASADYDGDGKTDIAVVRGVANDPNL
jgi:hypothetical protein